MFQNRNFPAFFFLLLFMSTLISIAFYSRSIVQGKALAQGLSMEQSFLPLIGNGKLQASTPDSTPTPTRTQTPTPTATKSPIVEPGWTIGCVDCPKLYYESRFSNRFLAVDPSGKPAVVYGFDHLYYARPVASSWETFTVDNSSRVGENAIIAFDQLSRDHILYFDTLNKALKYAFWNGSSWEISSIPTSGEVVWDNFSLTLDTMGKPHIAFISGETGVLKYATSSGSNWIIQTIESADMLRDLSLDLDQEGRPHFTFTNTYNQLKHVWWNGSVWSIEIVTTGASADWITIGGVSVEISSQNDIFLSFRTEQDLGLAVKSEDIWTIEFLGEAVPKLSWNAASFRLDSQDKPHLAFFSKTLNALRYAKKTGENWEFQTIDSFSKKAGGGIALGLDSAGKPSISYWDVDTGQLKYAGWTGSNWEFQIIDEGSKAAGLDLSLGLDSAGQSHISYWSQEEPQGDILNYAKRIGESWVIVNFDFNYPGSYYEPQIKLDAEDNPHLIVRLVGADEISDLLYLKWNGAEWVTETAVTGSETLYVSQSFSFDLDLSANPHLTFLKDNKLNYGYRLAGGWSFEVVDGEFSSEGYTSSLAIDQSGAPHIVYYNHTTGYLKYAKKVNSKWELQTIQKITSTDYTFVHLNPQISLVVDNEGRPHIAFSVDEYYLNYAARVGGIWEIRYVDRLYVEEPFANRSYDNTDIGIDENGLVLICYMYFSESGRMLKLAKWMGNEWAFETIPTENSVGNGMSMTIGSQSEVTIAFQDWPNSDLLLAEYK